MSAAAALLSGPSSPSHFRAAEKGASFHPPRTIFFNGGGFSKPSMHRLFLRSFSDGLRMRPISVPLRPFSPVMEWQDCRAEIELDVPCSVAYQCYSDRESIPKWMPFISSVKLIRSVFEQLRTFPAHLPILKDKPDLSRWSLKYEVFGRDVEFAWLARNMQPIPNQKIHWRSLDGLPNRGAVRFFPKGTSACRVELSISYEVPQILIPVAAALKPFMESLLLNGLERFRTVAKEYQSSTTPR